KRKRMSLGLSLREVERRSLELVEQRQNPDYSLSKAWLTDVEKGRFIPGTFRPASLAEIYGMGIAEIQEVYCIGPGDITKSWPLYRPPKTHLLMLPEGPQDNETQCEETSSDQIQVGKTSLVSHLVDIWGGVPVPLLRHFDLRRCLYGYIG